MSGGVPDAMMPEDNIPRSTMTLNIGLLVDEFPILVILIGRFGPVLRAKIVIKSTVAFRPDRKSAPSGRDVIDISDNAEVKGMSINMARGRSVRYGSVW